MKGSECRLIEYMNGSQKRFIIPVYQRNYDWKIENCKQLYDDLVKLVKCGKKRHFFGSMVSVYEPTGMNTDFLVIDGQQRLTTVSLLLLAMHNLMEKKIIVPQDAFLKQRIFEEFLVDKYQPKETRMKLKPIKNDQTAFRKLFDDETEYIKGSNLTANYLYFYERIQKQEIGIDQLFDAICRLEIINIKLDHDDNPQLIFESLNSTGLDLSEGDKIRNFILMGLPSEKQTEYYENYWNKIEECTKYDVSSFVRDYLSIKQLEIPPQKRIYISFKEYVERLKLQTEGFLKDLLKYAKRYKILLEGKTGYKTLDACIYRLNRLETTVTRPFFLEILRLKDEQKLTTEQVTEIFLLTEKYLFRRMICDLPTNALNKIFLLLHREVVRYDGTESDYVEKLKYALSAKKERARFPDDAEFATAFSERQIYMMNPKNRSYIMERLENGKTKEDKDIYRHLDDGDYSIEHVMPQNLTPAWMQELGTDYQKIHDVWLHRIANLTLVAASYNSKYSNSPFTEKKNMKHGFLDSGIRLNASIAKQEHWTQKELEERSRQLTQQALEIWDFPKTTYRPKEKQMDSYTLEDDASAMTGRQIARFRYKNTEQPVTSWADACQKIIQILFTKDKTILTNLAISAEEGLAYNFNTDSTVYNKCAEVGEGIYVWTNTSTQSKLSVLTRLFMLYHEEPSDLVFYLRDEGEGNADEPGSRYELRRKYWAYALPFIKEANGNDVFAKVNPSKENWINGFFGIGGFNLCCVANYDAARVELYLGKADAGANKKAYERLLSHKESIEAALGQKLTWDKNPDGKSSKVSYTLPDVSIEDETDWKRMAQFHAEWSKKFYDVFVPYLLDKQNP